MKRFFGKTDALIVLILAAALGLLFFWNRSDAPAHTAEVLCDGQEAITIDLQAVEVPHTVVLENGIVLEVENGQIRVLSSPCKDKLCVQCGALTTDGDTAVCLPERTLVRVSGKRQKTAPDIITY